MSNAKAEKLQRISDGIESYLRRHSTTLKQISDRLPSMFEGLCLVYVAEYYETLKYDVKPKNLFNGSFRLKFGTMGDPQNFSYFEVKKGTLSFEIRHNLPVRGARDSTTLYVADIAVINSHSVQKEISLTASGRRRTLHYCANRDLKSFAEVKDLIAYSMLIAQFLGVVFELKPRCLRKTWFSKNLLRFKNHMFPSLMISGSSHIGANAVIHSLSRRNYTVVVACDLLQSSAQFDDGQERIRQQPVIVTAP